MLHRRMLLWAAPLAVAGCTQLGSGEHPEAVVAGDLELIANAVQTQIPALLANANGNVQAQVQAAVQDLAGAAAAVRTAATSKAVQTDVQRALADLNAITAFAAQLAVIPPQWRIMAAAIAALLPVIEAEAGLPPAPRLHLRGMTPQSARTVLKDLS